MHKGDYILLDVNLLDVNVTPGNAEASPQLGTHGETRMKGCSSRTNVNPEFAIHDWDGKREGLAIVIYGRCTLHTCTCIESPPIAMSSPDSPIWRHRVRGLAGGSRPSLHRWDWSISLPVLGNGDSILIEA